MFVYLLRHGIAEDFAAGGDAARRLTREGRDRLAAAAPTWRRCVQQLDRVYTSPLIRAAETAAELVAAVDHSDPIVELPGLVPEADPRLAAEILLADVRAGCHAVAMVGHEPHLGSLLGTLLHCQASIPFKRGMLVGVELSSAAAAFGRLVLCLSTKHAARADGRR